STRRRTTDRSRAAESVPLTSPALVMENPEDRRPAMRPQELHDEASRRGAHFDGAPPRAAVHYGDPEREAAAAFETGVVRAQSQRAIVAVQGKDRLEFVNRMSTNEVRGVSDGAGVAAVLPTAKGRIVDFVRVVSRGETLLLLGSDGQGAAVKAWLEKHVVMEELALEDRSDGEASLLLLGPRAADA